jgi:hypothetical protein
VPNSLTKASIENIRQSKWNFLLMNDLTAQAKTNERMGNFKKAEMLYRQYEKNFPEAIPVKYLKQSVLAEIGYVSNNFSAQKKFEVKKDTKIIMFGSGQSLHDPYVEYHLNTLDGIELYLDAFNKKTRISNIKDYQYLYRFNYKYDKISGNYLSIKNIEFACGDPQDSVYVLEVKIPWKTLGIKKPYVGKSLGLNIFIIDNDMDQRWRKSLLYWSSQAWDCPSDWGTLVLTAKPSFERSKTAYCPKISLPIKIDGILDKNWDKERYCQINHLKEGTISSKSDNSASFKTLWDEQFLYFLFRVVDNVKQPAGIVATDKGWI